MNFVWKLHGVSIGSVSMNRWDGMQMWTSGYCFTDLPSRILQWEATALQDGWYIVITALNGKIGEYQGTTFNLPLEICAAVRRLA